MVWLPPIPKTKKELENIIATERNMYREALVKIATAKLEPGYVYQQAMMMQNTAEKALVMTMYGHEKNCDCALCKDVGRRSEILKAL